MAAALGIDRSRIKTVAVYEGSVIVDFFIEMLTSSDDDSSKSEKEITQMAELLVEVVNSGAADLGAPILGVEGNGALLAGDPIPANPNGGGSTGGSSTAIRKDDNIWDRYVRIQDIL